MSVKIQLGFLFCILVLFSPGICADEFVWRQSNTGGGGYIIGFLHDPVKPDHFYARCDVAGVFKSVDKGKTWRPMNGGLTRWYNHYVRSIAIHPRIPGMVFRCSGDMRNNTFFGSINKSLDGGETWKEVSNQAAFFGNGHSRQYGEVMAIDEKSDSIMVVGGYTKGIWRSADYGETWKSALPVNETFINLAIDTISRNYFASTLDGNLYISLDKGKTWKIQSKHPLEIREMIFVPLAGKSRLFISSDKGIFKSDDYGKTFEKTMDGLPEYGYIALSADPSNMSVMYCSPDVRPHHKLAPIPIYKSVNGGKSWQLIATHSLQDIRNKPSYYEGADKAGWAISKIRVDRTNPQHLLFSNWYGVCESLDGGLTYDANKFKGMETCCLEHVQFKKGSENTVCFTLADHRPMISHDNGRTYSQLENQKYSSSTAFVFSKSNPDLILYGGYYRLELEPGMEKVSQCGIVRVENGKSTIVLELKGGYVQAIKEDARQKGVFYAYIDGKMNDVAGIYRSNDAGISWKKINHPFGDNIKTLPVNRPFIENELLNIVVGQVKNVVGCNQLMETDPFRVNQLYIGEWTTGLYKSTNGGKSWTSISKGLPFGKDTASVLTVIKCHPTKKDLIYAGFIREGLWKSEDAGKNWVKVYPNDNSLCNVSSLYIGSRIGDEIVIGGENLYWSDVPVSLLYSKNGGKSFQQIYDSRLGALRIKGVDMNDDDGRIFVVTSGNGAFYIDKK